MYGNNRTITRWHAENFGPQDQFGYKDFIPMFTAEKFDPNAWAELFKRAGARYVIPTAEHSDGWANWDSDLTRWDAMDMGPKRDLIGDLALLGWIVVARILGKEEFGQLAIVQSTVGMLGVIAGLGLGLTATKHVAELRDSSPERVGRILSLTFITALITGGLSAAVLLAASPYIAVRAIGAPQLATVLRIGCWLLFFNTIYGVTIGALAGFEAFKTIAKVSLVTGLAKVFFMTIGVFYWALPGAVSAMVAAAVVSSAIGYYALLKKAHEFGTIISYQNVRSELPILWSFSIPGCLSSAIVPPVVWVTHAMLV